MLLSAATSSQLQMGILVYKMFNDRNASANNRKRPPSYRLLEAFYIKAESNDKGEDEK